ncbi:tRNA lysidine(34) synthetase TilS [Roseivirga misakiensis]|uniref:tRNA(Ile)-lysidine synthase n=1 Tax=Roseivirga misakiensis TaxID=1563681 RepID=A0A1E5T152_9BACT|nr:tRNA lysidine(34) synthetase TilS [Roseivirga misakiensis]OEK05037.1 tRNA lysidine(34) synthetase TilS [Roseivirga misakiensis]
MLKSFSEQLKKHAQFPPKGKLLLAISGGVDSMVLWDLVSRLKVDYAVAHCNFQLRGDASDADEVLVKTKAQSLKVTCHVNHFDTKSYSTIHKVSTQMAARDLRYEWFKEICLLHDYQYIGLAHHANDDVETFLLNMVRGTSLKGQKGMHYLNGQLLRPLLNIRKEELLDYAKEHRIEWREDKSNESVDYNRNYIRHEVIPKLETLNPDLLGTMKRNMQKNDEVYHFFKASVDRVKSELLESKEGHILIEKDNLKLHEIGPYVLSQLLEKYGFTYGQCDDILSQINGVSGKVFHSPHYRLLIDRTALIISKHEEESQTEVRISQDTLEFTLSDRYEISYLDNFSALKLDRSLTNAMLDADKLHYPLTIRRWRMGDKFMPLGMKGAKLVSDLLIDLKVSLIDKESIHVLESAGEIAWVIGLRLSDKFKVTNDTQRIVHFVKLEA